MHQNPITRRVFVLSSSALAARGVAAETGSAWHCNRVIDYLAQRESAKDTKGKSAEEE